MTFHFSALWNQCDFHKSHPEHIREVLSCLSIRRCADLRRSRLVSLEDRHKCDKTDRAADLRILSIRAVFDLLLHVVFLVDTFLEKHGVVVKWEHGVVVRAFDLYWGGIRFESLSTHHCWSLSKSFIPSLVVWSMTKNNAFAEESETKRATVSSQAFVTLSKSQLQVYHYLTTWLQIWYHSLLWGDSIRKGADLEKQNCLFGVHPAVMGKLTSLLRKEPTIVMASRQCFLGV